MKKTSYAYWCCLRGSVMVTDEAVRVNDWGVESDTGNWLMEGDFEIPQALILSSDLKSKQCAFKTQFNLSFHIRHPLGYPPLLPKEMLNATSE